MSKLLQLDPLAMKNLLWPDVIFYDKQVETIYSVEENVETYVTAGNQLGKDYVAGFICLCMFLRAIKEGKTCRIVTTSVAEHHLTVLWGEIGRYVATSKFPLLAKDKGPVTMNYLEIRRSDEMDAKNPLNYLRGRVSAKGEGLAGHHGEVTLFVADEASGVDDTAYKMAQGWAKRLLIFGNPNPCAPTQFFRKGVEAGNLLAD